jgi:hypothetical protein
MKLAKLSLAAIMAVGAFSYVNASNLEDAIKGVQLNGFTRYRYYNESEKATKTDRHRFSASVTLTSPIADNLVGSVTADIDDNNYATNNAVTRGEAGQDLRVQQLWFKYATADYSFKLGKQALGTPVTYNYFSVATGNGAKFLYTGVKNWTFAAAGFVATDRNFALTTAADGNQNLYAAAAIGSVGPVNVQLWGFKMTNIVDDEEFFQIDGKVAGLSYKAQYVRGNLNSTISTQTQAFYALQLGYKMNNFGAKGGYIGTDKDGGFVDLAAGDGSGFAYGGINSQYVYANQADVSAFYAAVSASFGKTSVGAGYLDGSYHKVVDLDVSEWYVKAAYKYSKNFKTSVYYSDLGQDSKNNEFRFEAKYSF